MRLSEETFLSTFPLFSTLRVTAMIQEKRYQQEPCLLDSSQLRMRLLPSPLSPQRGNHLAKGSRLQVGGALGCAPTLRL